MLLAALAGGCGTTPEVEEETATVLAPADVATVRRDAIATGPRISGTLEPAQKAVIRAEAGGSVLEVLVEIGEVVTQGQRLGRIETSGSGDLWKSAQSGVVAAEQDLMVAEKDLERVRRLEAAGAVSPRDLEIAQSQRISAAARLEAARAQLASAGSQLGRTTLESPLAGVVSERAVNVGDVVSPGAAMFTVIEPSSLRLEGSVPATAISALKVGTTVRFEVQGYTGRTFEGTVERISPAVDPASRQIPILVSIPNPGGTLVSGLFAEGRVASEERQALVLPAGAIDRSGPTPTVLRVQEGVVERVEVQTGLQDERSERVEVVSGLTEGDLIILGGAHDVAPGSKVQLESRGSATADNGGEG